MIQLYQHQQEFVSSLREALRYSQSVLAQASTGFGKTVVAAYIALSSQQKNKRVLFTVHRRDLIKQTMRTFSQFGINFGIIAAGFTPNYQAPVQIASIDSLKRRLKLIPHQDLVVPDECHFSGSAGWSFVINHFKECGSKILGLTATPWRLDGKGLGDHFDVIVEGPSMRWLIKEGYLSDYEMYAPNVPNMSGIHTRMGDFATKETEAVMDNRTVAGDAIQHYLKYANGKRSLAYGVSIKHSQHIAEQFRAAGIMAVHVDGETPDREKVAAFRAFANREVKVITNCSLFCEGFDLSAQVGADVPIEAAILLRPTQSLSLYLQQVGRALRRKNQPAIILDHAGNCMRHGLPDDDRDWTLEGKEKRKGKSDSEKTIPIKQCDKCYFVHSPSPQCPKCGYQYPIQSRVVDEVDGDLEKVDKDAMRKQARRQQGSAETYDDLVKLGYQRGYKNPKGWAKHIMIARQRKEAEKMNREMLGVGS